MTCEMNIETIGAIILLIMTWYAMFLLGRSYQKNKSKKEEQK